MIAELGLPCAKVFYNQKRRERGITKNNFYALYDFAMLGITNLSKVPLRLVIGCGFISAFISFVGWNVLPGVQTRFLEKLYSWRCSVGSGIVFSWVGSTDCAGHHRRVCWLDSHPSVETTVSHRERAHQLLSPPYPRANLRSTQDAVADYALHRWSADSIPFSAMVFSRCSTGFSLTGLGSYSYM